MKGRPRTTAGVPPPRRPDPRPRPALLARAPADPGRRERHRRHLAQHPPRARPDASGHPRRTRRTPRATNRHDPWAQGDPGRPRPPRAPPSLRLHPTQRLTATSNPEACSNTTHPGAARVPEAQRPDRGPRVPIICGSPASEIRRLPDGSAEQQRCGSPPAGPAAFAPEFLLDGVPPPRFDPGLSTGPGGFATGNPGISPDRTFRLATASLPPGYAITTPPA